MGYDFDPFVFSGLVPNSGSGGGGGGANTSLSNLTSPTAINQDLLPASTDTINLGNPSQQFQNLYVQDIWNQNGNLGLNANENNIVLNNLFKLQQFDPTGNTSIGFKVNSATTTYDVTWPTSQGASGSVLTNSDGSGTLTWSPINSGTVTEVDTGTGLTGGPITSTGSIALANTAVTPGSFTSANITVDQQGRITSASSGSTGANTALSNLANPTAINNDLRPNADDTFSLGIGSRRWHALFTHLIRDSNADNAIDIEARNLLAADGTTLALNWGSPSALKLGPASLIWPATDGTAGQVLKTDGAGNLSWVNPSANILVFTSNPGPSGVAGSPIFDVAFTVPGLLSTDTILSVTQMTPGASGTMALLGWHSQANNALTGEYVADPGTGSVIVVAVKR